jgi:hypothetical protein
MSSYINIIVITEDLDARMIRSTIENGVPMNREEILGAFAISLACPNYPKGP